MNGLSGLLAIAPLNVELVQEPAQGLSLYKKPMEEIVLARQVKLKNVKTRIVQVKYLPLLFIVVVFLNQYLN